MGGNDMDDTIDDLLNQGLKPGVDFIAFDAGNLTLGMNMTPDTNNQEQDIDLGTDWLLGKFREGYVYVSHVS